MLKKNMEKQERNSYAEFLQVNKESVCVWECENILEAV